MTIDNIPPAINEAAKRLREIKASGYKVVAIESVYGTYFETAVGLVCGDHKALADWLLETFPEVGR